MSSSNIPEDLNYHPKTSSRTSVFKSNKKLPKSVLFISPSPNSKLVDKTSSNKIDKVHKRKVTDRTNKIKRSLVLTSDDVNDNINNEIISPKSISFKRSPKNSNLSSTVTAKKCSYCLLNPDIKSKECTCSSTGYGFDESSFRRHSKENTVSKMSFRSFSDVVIKSQSMPNLSNFVEQTSTDTLRESIPEDPNEPNIFRTTLTREFSNSKELKFESLKNILPEKKQNSIIYFTNIPNGNCFRAFNPYINTCNSPPSNYIARLPSRDLFDVEKKLPKLITVPASSPVVSSIIDDSADWDTISHIFDEHIVIIEDYFQPTDTYRRIIEHWDGSDDNADNCTWIEIVRDNTYQIKQASIQKTYQDLVELAHRMRFGKRIERILKKEGDEVDTSDIKSPIKPSSTNSELVIIEEGVNIVKSRKWKHHFYQNAFSGNECLDWMLANLKDDWGLVDRHMAFHLAYSLMACGFIRPCPPTILDGSTNTNQLLAGKLDAASFSNPFVMPFLHSPVVCFCPCPYCLKCRSSNNGKDKSIKLNSQQLCKECGFNCSCCALKMCQNLLKRSHPPVEFVDGLYFYQFTEQPPSTILNPFVVPRSRLMNPKSTNNPISRVSFATHPLFGNANTNAKKTKQVSTSSIDSSYTDSDSDDSDLSDSSPNDKTIMDKFKLLNAEKVSAAQINAINQREAAIHNVVIPSLQLVDFSKPGFDNSVVSLSTRALDTMIQLYRSIGFKDPTVIPVSENPVCKNLYAEFKEQISALRTVKLDSLNQESLLSFFLNIYNTLYMHLLIVSDLVHDSINKQKRLALSRSCAYEIDGSSYSLMDVKYGVLRANLPFPEVKEKDRFILLPPSFAPTDPRSKNVIQLADPRISFALCNGTVTSPRLQIYHPGTVYEQLESATSNYISAHVSMVQRPSASSAMYHLNAITSKPASSHINIPSIKDFSKNPPSKLSLQMMETKSRKFVSKLSIKPDISSQSILEKIANGFASPILSTRTSPKAASNLKQTRKSIISITGQLVFATENVTFNQPTVFRANPNDLDRVHFSISNVNASTLMSALKTPMQSKLEPNADLLSPLELHHEDMEENDRDVPHDHNDSSDAHDDSDSNGGLHNRRESNSSQMTFGYRRDSRAISLAAIDETAPSTMNSPELKVRSGFGVARKRVHDQSAHLAPGDSWSCLRVSIPKIFDWYRNDFGKSSENILKWIADHHSDVYIQSQILDFLGARSATLEISRYVWQYDGSIFSPTVRGSFA